MSGNNRFVFRRKEDHKWVNQRVGAERAGSVHDTQKEAAEAAREMLRVSGGGELTVRGRERIVSKDTVPPGNDPFPPRDREH